MVKISSFFKANSWSGYEAIELLVAAFDDEPSAWIWVVYLSGFLTCD